MTEATATRWTLRLEIKTGAGEVQSRALTSFSRPARATSPQEIGLTLAEAKGLLTNLQQSMVQRQVTQYTACARPCVYCQKLQPLKDRRFRRLQTLFGQVEVQAPRFNRCSCQPPPAGTMRVATVCPLAHKAVAKFL